MSGATTTSSDDDDDGLVITLEAKVVEPTQNKREKFEQTETAFYDALLDAFSQDCDTQSETNDVVVQYDLSGYAKNALKQFVPQLNGESYNANELKDEHPVRFTNEALSLDHKPENHYEWYAKIPHHEDYHLWVPLAINPEQERWYHALYDEESDVEFGETQLLERNGEWYVHIRAKTDSEPEIGKPESATIVGVDIGEASLLTVCHRDGTGSPVDPDLYSREGREVRSLRKTYHSIRERLQHRESTTTLEDIERTVWNRIDDVLHTVTRRVIEKLRALENPVLVLENLTYIRESMDYGAYMNKRLHGWSFRKLHSLLSYKAHDAGIPVREVDPWGTSKKCHVCGSTGYRPHQATFRCTNDVCWVSEYQADVNGAINIADKYRKQLYDLVGETRPREYSVVNDSGEDGGVLTRPQDNSLTEDDYAVTHGSVDNVRASSAQFEPRRAGAGDQ